MSRQAAFRGFFSSKIYRPATDLHLCVKRRAGYPLTHPSLLKKSINQPLTCAVLLMSFKGQWLT